MRPPPDPSRAASPRRSPIFLIAFALANVGGVIAYLPLLTLLLPLKIEVLSGSARIGVFTACVTAGAITASGSNILFGWLSDRSLHRGAGRRRWMAGGFAATAASYALVALAATPVQIVAAIVVFQFAVNALLAPMMAIMSEEIPDAQKGVAGGLLALGSPVASAMSTLLIGLATLPEAARLALVPCAVGLCVLPLLLGGRAVATGPTDPAAPAGTAFARRDLAVAGCSRLLVQVAGVVTQAYLLYYFESIVAAGARPDLPVRIGHLLTLAFVLPLPVALLLGRLSDVIRRRKPVLLLSASVATAGLVGMAAARDWTGGAIAFAVYAAGSSVFVALHAAFAMQLLPSPRHRGRDLGLLNLANTLPSLLGPPLTWMLATPRDFSAVMLTLGALTLCGGLGMLGVRAWR
ncbi:MFS transporter [Sphingomonas sp. A2-49]|uniref:MFS transporter n=1 Tax=Sphingomonas sp. A2-49 TaxID=1391375 RepID=UPI0021CFDCDF|nr:MFS transporter [Sphingomonas sp. A2-49]MCU6453758.1 MFS transporter [Sphingomonas sp. A2-49]